MHGRQNRPQITVVHIVVLNQCVKSSMKSSLTVIILTLDEEKHIRRCLESVEKIADRVVIVDCFSTDRTKELAREFGASVIEHEWRNYSSQFNWGLDNADIDTDWVMRLDADEVVTPKLAELINSELSEIPQTVHGLTVNRQIHFLGRWIRHGAIYPTRMLRLFRKGLGRCEERWMDEHIIVQGDIAHLKGDVADINLNNLTWWTNKHNSYATREAIDLLLMQDRHRMGGRTKMVMSSQARLKRWLKEKVYSRLPLLVRPTFYFLYRYVVRGGVLDGWQGFAYHFLQGYWYRTLVDLKVHELVEQMKTSGKSLKEVVYESYGYRLD